MNLKQAAENALEAMETWIWGNATLYVPQIKAYKDLEAALRRCQPLTTKELELLAEQHVTNCYFDTLTFAREIEKRHGIGGNE